MAHCALCARPTAAVLTTPQGKVCPTCFGHLHKIPVMTLPNGDAEMLEKHIKLAAALR